MQENDGTDDPTANESPVQGGKQSVPELFDIQGRKIQESDNLPHGIYILRDAYGTRKVWR